MSKGGKGTFGSLVRKEREQRKIGFARDGAPDWSQSDLSFHDRTR